METFDIIVIGAGAVGSAAAYHLAPRAKTLLLEQFEFMHKRGSSHGGSRIFRQVYEDAAYVRLALAADEAWRVLEQDSQDKVLYRTGSIDISRHSSEALTHIEQALREVGRPFERLAAETVNERFPAFQLDPDQEALYQADSGCLAASRAVGAMQRVAAQRGASLHASEPVEDIDISSQGVIVQTSKSRYAADRLVLSAGPWLSRFLPELELPLHVEQQQVLYLKVPSGSAYALGTMPIFIERDELVYGLPMFEYPTAIKVAKHAGGTRIDLAERTFELNRELASQTLAVTQALLPDVIGEIAHFETCLYTMTPDNHFILDRHPEHDHVVMGGGFSGHGFKFAPLLGEMLADLVLGERSRHHLNSFKLSRFGSGRLVS